MCKVQPHDQCSFLGEPTECCLAWWLSFHAESDIAAATGVEAENATENATKNADMELRIPHVVPANE